MLTLNFSVRNSCRSCNNHIICNQLKVNGLDSLDVTFSYCARGEDEEVGSRQPSAISFKLMSNLVLVLIWDNSIANVKSYAQVEIFWKLMVEDEGGKHYFDLSNGKLYIILQNYQDTNVVFRHIFHLLVMPY